ncbi:MAG: DUF6516 family protein [Elusimicrobiota bacterium]|jgi:hypothetical protein
MGYKVPYNKAVLLFREKFIYPDGALVEMKAWAVPKSSVTPEGFKYSLVYIDPAGKRILGYDNSEMKGHHRHEGKREAAFIFISVDDVVRRFQQEVLALRKLYES